MCLYCVRAFKKSATKVNKDALLEYKCLNQDALSSTTKEILSQTIPSQFLFIICDGIRDMYMIC